MRSPRECRAHGVRQRAVFVLFTLLFGIAATAHADALQCKRTVAKASAAYAQATVKALQNCQDEVLLHAISGPCPDTTASGKIAKAETKLRTKVGRDCGGGDGVCGTGDDFTPASIGWGGSCPNFEHGSCGAAITNCNGINDCVTCVDRAAVDQAINLYYGSLASSTNGDVINCQRAIGKYATKFVMAKSKALAHCEEGVLTSGGGSCPDVARAQPAIAKADSKMRVGICKACGGSDRLCGTSDDLTPTTIGFPSNCPNVTVPGGASCGGAVTDLSKLVDCVDCVSEFKVDCVDALAAPSAKSYPAECNGGSPGPTPTHTQGGVGPTPTRTPTPGGGGGTPQPTTTPGGPCVLPNPLPEVVSFFGRPGPDLDTGWTGQAHDVVTDDAAPLSAARLSNCDTNLSSPTCGQCQIDGPVLFPGPAKNCACYNLGNRDVSSLTSCDPEMPSTCSGNEVCQCFYGPPLPITSGAVPVCVINRYTQSLTGTANIANSGPHPGEGSAIVHLEAGVFNGLAVDEPCPRCVNDPTPRDGVRGGTCNGGARDGQPCDVQGDNTLFGPMSLDCQPNFAATIGNLQIAFNTLTTGTTTLASGPTCTAPGFTSMNCFCDTCGDAAGEPCNSNADCPGGVICGGKRCIGGANAGAVCAATSECPSGNCGRPGQATAPNQCRASRPRC